MTDNYDLVPHKEIKHLKEEIEKLRSGESSNTEMLDSISTLAKSIENLNELFYSATEEMKQEEKSEELLVRRLQPMSDKLDEISEQNQKIARAIIALTDMIKEKEQHIMKAPPRPAPHLAPKVMPAYQFNPQRAPPLSGLSPPPGQPPSELPLGREDKKKGLFSRFGK